MAQQVHELFAAPEGRQDDLPSCTVAVLPGELPHHHRNPHNPPRLLGGDRDYLPGWGPGSRRAQCCRRQNTAISAPPVVSTSFHRISFFNSYIYARDPTPAASPRRAAVARPASAVHPDRATPSGHPPTPAPSSSFGQRGISATFRRASLPLSWRKRGGVVVVRSGCKVLRHPGKPHRRAAPPPPSGEHRPPTDTPSEPGTVLSGQRSPLGTRLSHRTGTVTCANGRQPRSAPRR